VVKFLSSHLIRPSSPTSSSNRLGDAPQPHRASLFFYFRMLRALQLLLIRVSLKSFTLILCKQTCCHWYFSLQDVEVLSGPPPSQGSPASSVTPSKLYDTYFGLAYPFIWRPATFSLHSLKELRPRNLKCFFFMLPESWSTHYFTTAPSKGHPLSCGGRH